MPKLNLERLPAETEPDGSTRDDAGEAGTPSTSAGGKGGGSAGGGRGGAGGKGGTGGPASGGAGAPANGGGGKGGTGGSRSGDGDGSAGSAEEVDAGRDAGDEPDETPAGAGGTGSGGEGGNGEGGRNGEGGNGGGTPSGPMDAGVDAGSGSGGTGGGTSSPPTYCSTWRRQNSDGAFDDLGPNPGEEMNDSGTVRQYVCRTVPNGRSELALGKGVPPYGCYGTYASSGTRIGYGKASDFEVLLPNTSDCQVTWQAVTSSVVPFDLGTSSQPGLYACRGRLENVPSDGGGNISGRELGQWVEVAGERQCWTQFHNSTAGQDTGSKRVIDQLEVLVRAP